MWIGQTWDGPPLSLKKEGKPVSYQAPKEGAIAWLDGLSLIKAAKNSIRSTRSSTTCRRRKSRPQVADGSGYNPVVTGADALTSDAFKKNFQEAYPGDALKNLWPGRPSRLVRRNPQPVCRQVQGGLIRRTTDSCKPAPKQFGAGLFWADLIAALDLCARLAVAKLATTSTQIQAESLGTGDRADERRRRTRPRHRPIRQFHRRDDATLNIKGGRVLLLPRAIGLRQDDDPAHRLGLPRSLRRRGPDRRPGHGGHRPQQAADRADLPEPRALPADDRGREHHLWPARARRRQGRPQSAGPTSC